MITLFEARDNLYSQIKRIPGFKGITINTKVGIYGILIVYVEDFETKERLMSTYGNMQDGYYVQYVIKGNGIEFL